MRIYPSTVFAGQDICFNVFSDYSFDGSREQYLSAKIGEYTMEFDTYDEQNVAAHSTWSNYQICGTAGGGLAKSSNDLTIIGATGKYLVHDLAKSYDGTNEYVVRTIPSISEVSSNSFYKAPGAIVTIKGDGFDQDPTKNTVTVDDVTCEVFESTMTHLKCTLGEKTTTSSATSFVGGTGARVKEYSGYSSITDSTTATNTLYYTDIDARRNSDADDDALVRVVEGWFVPPQTGGYIFHASCDDQ
jgi:hypothetical protein